MCISHKICTGLAPYPPTTATKGRHEKSRGAVPTAWNCASAATVQVYNIRQWGLCAYTHQKIADRDG